jgi:putative phosphoesterase
VIVGVLSDTHGKAQIAASAVKLLLAEGAEYLIHCGDVGEADVLDCLAGHPSMFVFGNNDWDQQGLARYAKQIGVECGGEIGNLSLGDKRAVVTHGDSERLIDQVLKEQAVDYLFLGHTHHPMDQRHGRVRIINPGALYRATQKTVAVLDTAADKVQFHVVKAIQEG